jgi:hypothetical protein
MSKKTFVSLLEADMNWRSNNLDDPKWDNVSLEYKMGFIKGIEQSIKILKGLK